MGGSQPATGAGRPAASLHSGQLLPRHADAVYHGVAGCGRWHSFSSVCLLRTVSVMSHMRST
jgi:hypothetical protein